MVKPEQVPKEAMEAAAVQLSNGKTTTEAIATALNAWPGMKTETTFWSNADGAGCGRHVLSLPLPPQEDSDE